MLVFLALTAFLVIIVFTAFNYFAFFNAAPYIPTSGTTLSIMRSFAKLHPHKKAVELGSGDGRIVIALAKMGIEIDGYEINPILVVLSKILIKINRVDKIAHIHWKSFWNISFTEYDLVTCYCIPNKMKKLSEKLNRELPKNALIISNSFTFESLILVEEKDNVRLYTV